MNVVYREITFISPSSHTSFPFLPVKLSSTQGF
jgi:hypothetical protein